MNYNPKRQKKYERRNKTYLEISHLGKDKINLVCLIK